MEEFLTEVFGGEQLVSATLSEVRVKETGEVQRVTIRAVLLRGKRVYQFEYQYAQKVQHRNLTASEAKALTRTLLSETFRQGLFTLADGSARQVSVNAQNKFAVRKKEAAAKTAALLTHDRQKNYLLAEDVPVDFLVRLGVMTTAGKVVAAKRDKFKQINRFLEMVDDVAGSLPAKGPLKVIDFGCGKAYLTFALYYYLTVIKQKEVTLIGLDLKADVVEFCGKVAAELGYSSLSFAVGDIESYQLEGTLDMVVTLHACDTATDDALVKAIEWGASVILSVPCCQHELFGQIASDTLRPLLKHGILKERLTALVTDSIRASLLESAGYTVQILEFIALEHTAKNLLIRAVKRPGQSRLKAPSTEYEAFRDFWHIHPHLESALNALRDEE